MPASRLDASVLVSTPTGNIELNAAPYQLAGDSFGSVGVTHRRSEVTNPFVEGSYTVNALRENISTPVAFWVRGVDHFAMSESLKHACAAFDQSQFTVTVTIENWVQIWQCFASDYTVTMQREFLHATIAMVEATVIHHPGIPGWTNLVSALDVEA